MNHQQLTTFCTVLGEGSMTAAADKLFLTQPAVSQQIRNLEEDLGVNLLERGVRKVKPTLQGQLLFDYARKILHLTQQAEVAIQTMSQELSGNLRIATQNGTRCTRVLPRLPRAPPISRLLSVRRRRSARQTLSGDTQRHCPRVTF